MRNQKYKTRAMMENDLKAYKKRLLKAELFFWLIIIVSLTSLIVKIIT